MIYVSHPSEHKNHPQLVHAFALCVRETPGSLLLTLDPEPEGGTRYAGFIAQIRAAAERHGVSDRVKLLGVLTAGEVRYALQRADLSVFPSLSESFGLGLVESLAARCAIAASDRAFAHEIAGSAAEYFDPEDPESMARVLTRLLRAPDRLAKLRAMSSERAALFAPRSVAERLCDILEAAAVRGRA
jgi:glycosyltransferase involved in cell wall biosynthesis